MAGTLVQQEVNRQVREAAEEARTTISEVLADPKIRTHGMTHSQWQGLADVLVKLRDALA